MRLGTGRLGRMRGRRTSPRRRRCAPRAAPASCGAHASGRTSRDAAARASALEALRDALRRSAAPRPPAGRERAMARAPKRGAAARLAGWRDPAGAASPGSRPAVQRRSAAIGRRRWRPGSGARRGEGAAGWASAPAGAGGQPGPQRAERAKRLDRGRRSSLPSRRRRTRRCRCVRARRRRRAGRGALDGCGASLRGPPGRGLAAGITARCAPGAGRPPPPTRPATWRRWVAMRPPGRREQAAPRRVATPPRAGRGAVTRWSAGGGARRQWPSCLRRRTPSAGFGIACLRGAVARRGDTERAALPQPRAARATAQQRLQDTAWQPSDADATRSRRSARPPRPRAPVHAGSKRGLRRGPAPVRPRPPPRATPAQPRRRTEHKPRPTASPPRHALGSPPPTPRWRGSGACGRRERRAFAAALFLSWRAGRRFERAQVLRGAAEQESGARRRPWPGPSANASSAGCSTRRHPARGGPAPHARAAAASTPWRSTSSATSAWWTTTAPTSAARRARCQVGRPSWPPWPWP